MSTVRQRRPVAYIRGQSRAVPLVRVVGLLLQTLRFIMQSCQFRNVRARLSAQP